MGQLEQTFERQYKPIEPEGFFERINPYRESLKYVVENLKEKPVRSILEVMALIIAPGGILYVQKEANNIRKEVCLEQGKEFVGRNLELEFGDGTLYMMEFLKTSAECLGLYSLSKLIF